MQKKHDNIIIIILPTAHNQVISYHTISQAQNSRHHNKVLLLKHGHLSRPMYFRSGIHVDLGLFQSHRKQVLATIILQVNQHSSQLGFFTMDQSSHHIFQGLVFIKPAAEGSPTVFTFPYPSSMRLCP